MENWRERPKKKQLDRLRRAEEGRQERLRQAEKERQEKVKEEAVKNSRLMNQRKTQMMRRGLKVGDRVTTVGHSTSPGDAVVRTLGSEGAVLSHQNGQLIIRDPRMLTTYRGNETGLSSIDSQILVLLCQAESKFEAAVSLLYCECYAGVCSCKPIAHGKITMPKSWTVGDRVRVNGFADADIEKTRVLWVGGPKVKIRYDDW